MRTILKARKMAITRNKRIDNTIVANYNTKRRATINS